MCGIVAIVNQPIIEGSFTAALNTLRHRGPDATGSWQSSSDLVWLGHQRLSIVDLSESGIQPMHNEDKSIWLTCNGEIYNFPSLRNRLKNLGHTFYSNSDSEVIIHAYEAWGERCVEHLEGMYAFAIWDEIEKKLFVGRDPVGIKPLYYSEVDNGLIVSSETRAILSLLPSKPDVNPEAFAYFMTVGYVPSPLSMWKGIHKLDPGHTLAWRKGHNIAKTCYWEPPRHIIEGSSPASEEWPQLFESVLDEHLLADVPVGMFLSGGLDSASVALGLKKLDYRPETITISFPDSVDDEAGLAASIGSRLGFDSKVVPLTLNNIDPLIQETISAFDEPQGYSALISMYLVCQAAAGRFKVVLTGDGGDEIFGGYNWYNHLDRAHPRHTNWPGWVISQLTKPAWPTRISNWAKNKFALQSPLHHHAWRVYPRFLPEEAKALLKPLGVNFSDADMLRPFYKHFEPNLPLKRALQRIDLMTFCSDSILPKVDKASMHHSLEVRVPFLDRRIIEWALTRPEDTREKEKNKPILRDYLKGRVPSSVLEHPKQGFSLRILSDYKWNSAINSIQDSPLVTEGYLSSDWKQFLKPRTLYREGRIWNLLLLSHWARIWLGRT